MPPSCLFDGPELLGFAEVIGMEEFLVVYSERDRGTAMQMSNVQHILVTETSPDASHVGLGRAQE